MTRRIPNHILLDADLEQQGLNPIEYRVYCHLVYQITICDTPKFGAGTSLNSISPDQVNGALHRLASLGMIEWTPQGNHIALTDSSRWLPNRCLHCGR